MRSPQLEASMDKLFAATAQDGEKMRRVGIGEAQHQQVTHSHETPNPVQARIFEYDSGTTTKVTLASLSLMHLTALLLIPPQPKRGETVKVKPGETRSAPSRSCALSLQVLGRGRGPETSVKDELNLSASTRC